jgi:polyisoprenyl-teichoic acid--peptidoglycan teichoic acid transferase
VVLLLILGAIVVLGYVVWDRTFRALGDIADAKDVRPEVVEAQESGPTPALLQQPFNVLLIGVDARDTNPEDGARSDTLIVVRVDPVNQWASMLSIPRDTFVRIPYRDDVEGGKITSAYTWGYSNPEIYGEGTRPDEAGAALAADTVEEFLDIKIDYTAQVNFQGFEQLVDAIGGITVDVPHTILDAEYPTEDYGYERLLIEPGLQRMDGATALKYARTRHADNDFGRAARQQQVLQEAARELRQRGILQQVEALPQLIEAMRSSIQTTMPIDDLQTLRGMGELAQQIGTDRIMRFSINPSTVALDERYDNRYDIHWDSAGVAQVAKEFQQGPLQASADEPETATIQVQNGKGIKGLAGQISLDLELAGYTVADPADAPTPDNPNTLVLDYTGKPETRAKLGQFFGLDPANVRDMTAEQEQAPFGVDIVVLVGEDYQAR